MMCADRPAQTSGMTLQHSFVSSLDPKQNHNDQIKFFIHGKHF